MIDSTRPTRCGWLGASSMGDIMAKTQKGAWAASRYNVLARLMCERLTGVHIDTFSNFHMDRGNELEPLNRAAYELRTGAFVDITAFIPHPTIEYWGASPDGLVGDDGVFEAKCLNAANHLEILRTGDVSKYLPQVQTQMLVTGRAWADLCFFHPDFPEHLQHVVKRVEADAEFQKLLTQAATIFLAEVQEALDELAKVAA
jgi:predicted phage-related endonuclease